MGALACCAAAPPFAAAAAQHTPAVLKAALVSSSKASLDTAALLHGAAHLQACTSGFETQPQLQCARQVLRTMQAGEGGRGGRGHTSPDGDFRG